MASSIEPELPRAFVLGYLTQTKTASRARAVTAIAVLVLGLASLSVGSWILISTGRQIYNTAVDISVMHGGPLTSFDLRAALDELRWRWRGEWPTSLRAFSVLTSPEGRAGWILLFVVPGGLQALLAWFVWRRRRLASRIAWLLTLPILIIVIGATAVVNAWALVWGLQLFGGHAEHEALVWLGTLPVGVFLALLLKDLCAYLLWFARNSYFEKPRVEFLSGRSVAGPES